jgi:signal peptidase
MSTEALIDPSARTHARAGARSAPAPARFAARFAAAVAAGLVVGALLAAGLSLALGYRTFSVLSGSMEPAIHTGDAVVDEQISPLAARVGDVVTFKDPSRHGQLVTHRLRSVRPHGATVSMVTKGDANTAVERWTVATRGTIGRVAYRLPRAGRAFVAIRGRFGRLLLIALPALCLGVYELGKIWRPGPRPRPGSRSG